MVGKSLRSFGRPTLAGGVLVACLAMTMSSAAATTGGLYSASATPHGYSLADLSQATALFTTSGNSPAYLPQTPFQILYTDPAKTTSTFEDGGLVVQGSNSFVAKAGTQYYLPAQNFDDSPPVLGTFPTTHAQAIPYVFDPAQYGAHDYQAVIDGSTTALDASYVAGPVTTPPLLDGGGTHYITLGAFVKPLAPGTHTVTISGELSGAGLESTYGIAFLQESFTYTVTVRPGT
jgi:hypothetical protein